MSELKPEFIRSLEGEPLFVGLADALASTDPTVSVRLNPRRPVQPWDGAEPVPWWPQGGLYLPERPAFTFDPALHQGRYYPQDASSMALAAVVKNLTRDMEGPMVYLDACSAPGGKTTAAIDALPAGSFVVANEYDFHRAAILTENVAKWGSGYTLVSRGYTARLGRLEGLFQIAAVDAPCSGEGMMRKDQEAASQWSESLVRECAERQRQIIANVWPSIRPGGYLIYSTCTFNRQENEDVTRWIIDEYGAESVPLPESVSGAPGVAPALDDDLHAARFLPGRVRGEGLYITVLRKGDGRPFRPGSKRRTKSGQLPSNSWLEGDWTMRLAADTLRAVPTRWVELADDLTERLDTIDCGITAFTLKGRDMIPCQPLALAADLRNDAFVRAAVDRPTALEYLRRQAVAVPDAPRGIVLLEYDGVPLGFVKNLGNRANNLYPAPWRILKQC